MTYTLLTTQKLTSAPTVQSESDVPSGTFQATELIVPDTTPAGEGGKVLIAEGVNTEEAIIIRVVDATTLRVEQLVNTYTNAAMVTFLGRTNPGDPTGTTTVKNASGKGVNGSKNKAETFWNNIIKDLLKIKKSTVDIEDGIINGSNVTIDADATTLGDRSLVFKLTASLSRILKYNSSTGRMRLEDQTGALVPLELGLATQDTQAVTKSQMDASKAEAIEETLEVIPYTPKRQIIQYAKVDANNKAAFLSPGFGLQTRLEADVVPFRASLAAGYGPQGAIDYLVSFNTIKTFDSLAPNATNFHYLERNPTNGIWTLGSATAQQIMSPFFPVDSSGSINNFEGTNGATTVSDVYPGRSWTLVNATISTAAAKFGTSSLALNGTNAYAQSDDIVLPGGTTPWTMEIFVNSASFGAGRIVFGGPASNVTMLAGLDSATSLRWGVSSNGSNLNVFDSNIAIPTAVAGTWYHFVIQFTGTEYQSYWNGTRYHNVSSATPAYNFNTTINKLHIGHYNTSYFSGNVDAFKFTPGVAVYSGATITPPSAPYTPTNPTYDWYDTVAEKSKVGNFILGWEDKQRIFIGESVTNASAVTSVVSYAIGGKYVSDIRNVVASTVYTFADNIGCPLKKVSGYRRENQNLPWCEFERYVVSNPYGASASITDRNFVKAYTGTYLGSASAGYDSSESFVNNNAASGQIYVCVERGF